MFSCIFSRRSSLSYTQTHTGRHGLFQVFILSFSSLVKFSLTGNNGKENERMFTSDLLRKTVYMLTRIFLARFCVYFNLINFFVILLKIFTQKKNLFCLFFLFFKCFPTIFLWHNHRTYNILLSTLKPLNYNSHDSQRRTMMMMMMKKNCIVRRQPGEFWIFTLESKSAASVFGERWLQ